MKAKLSNAQADMLIHRLEGPDDLIYAVFGFDCLDNLPHYHREMRGDSLSDADFAMIRATSHLGNFDEASVPWAEADGDEAHDILTKQIGNNMLDTSEWNEACPELLAELLEGSTYVAACEYDEPLVYARALRTMRCLETKLEPLVGRAIMGADC